MLVTITANTEILSSVLYFDEIWWKIWLNFHQEGFWSRGGLDLLSGPTGQGGPVCQDPILRIDLLKIFQFAHSVIEVSDFLFVILF